MKEEQSAFPISFLFINFMLVLLFFKLSHCGGPYKGKGQIPKDWEISRWGDMM